MPYDADKILARAQVGLAFFYALIAVGIFATLAWLWPSLSKLDVSIFTMFGTSFLNQSNAAGNYFFARHRSQNGGSDNTISGPSPGDIAATAAPHN
jgi:hypothetical protein